MGQSREWLVHKGGPLPCLVKRKRDREVLPLTKVLSYAWKVDEGLDTMLAQDLLASDA